MHDFLLAKEIMDRLNDVVLGKNISSVKKVYIEIGEISLSHDGLPEHVEDITIENLKFGLKSMAKEKIFKNAKFFIRKVPGNHWKLTNIEAE